MKEKKHIDIEEAIQRLERVEEKRPEVFNDNPSVVEEPHPLQIALPISSKERGFFASIPPRARALRAPRREKTSDDWDVREEDEDKVDLEWSTCIDAGMGTFDESGKFILDALAEKISLKLDAGQPSLPLDSALPPAPEQEKQKENDNDDDDEWTVVKDKTKKKPRAKKVPKEEYVNNKPRKIPAKKAPEDAAKRTLSAPRSRDAKEHAEPAPRHRPEERRAEERAVKSDSDSEGFVLVKEKRGGR